MCSVRGSPLQDFGYCHMRRLAILTLCLPWLGMACDCVEQEQPQARRAAYAVFDGTVTEIHYFETEAQQRTSSRVLVTFAVSRSWKGPVGPKIKIHNWERALMCDSYIFEVGHRYVVYAIQQDKEGGWADQYPAGTKILSVGGCILRIREDVEAEAKRLGQSRKPVSN
jgi:hypothetical protein